MKYHLKYRFPKNFASSLKYRSGIVCLAIVVGLFSLLGWRMGAAPMLNTVMHTAHDLLLNTCFYLMAICVLTGAVGKIFVEFGVVDLLEKLLRPLMRPLFNLPGVASLGAVLTFLSDNPAIITLSKDKHFSAYFKKYQLISLTNFGTAFGMGLIVIIFMVGQGFFKEPLIGLFGAFVGCVVSTRFMQYFVLKAYPNIDQKRVCETGGSYGGLMTNWIVGHTDRFCAVASQRSISNWLSFAGVSDIGPDFAADQNAAGLWNDPEKLWWHSPLKYADRVKTPTLFIHAFEDYRCPVDQGYQMFTALVAQGVETKLVCFRGENHELSRSGKPSHRLKRLKEITDWFDKHDK